MSALYYIVIVYSISVILNIIYERLYYSPKGIGGEARRSVNDGFLIWMPIINTLALLSWFIWYPIQKSEK